MDVVPVDPTVASGGAVLPSIPGGSAEVPAPEAVTTPADAGVAAPHAVAAASGSSLSSEPRAGASTLQGSATEIRAVPRAEGAASVMDSRSRGAAFVPGRRLPADDARLSGASVTGPSRADWRIAARPTKRHHERGGGAGLALAAARSGAASGRDRAVATGRAATDGRTRPTGGGAAPAQVPVRVPQARLAPSPSVNRAPAGDVAAVPPSAVSSDVLKARRRPPSHRHGVPSWMFAALVLAASAAVGGLARRRARSRCPSGTAVAVCDSGTAPAEPAIAERPRRGLAVAAACTGAPVRRSAARPCGGLRATESLESLLEQPFPRSADRPAPSRPLSGRAGRSAIRARRRSPARALVRSA